MKKLSSYQKLKKEYDDLYKLYQKARRRLYDNGYGIDEDDFLMPFDCESPNPS